MPPEETPLAAAQAALVRTLAGRGGAGELPSGFDSDRVRATSQLLLDKRLRAATRVCPALRRELDARLPALFTEYVRAGSPHDENATADVASFLGWLRLQCGAMPDGLRAAAVELRLRRGWGVAVAWLPSAGQLRLGLRLPLMRRARFWELRMRSRGRRPVDRSAVS